MDILTVRGQESARHELRAAELFERRFRYRYNHTPKERPAVVDAVVTKDGAISCIVETKCRDMTYDLLMGRYRGEWLITLDKLERAAALAKGLCVPLVGCLYLIPDDLLLVLTITRPDGSWALEFRRERTGTQETINGGFIHRINAYLPMHGATVIA